MSAAHQLFKLISLNFPAAKAAENETSGGGDTGTARGDKTL